MAKFADVLTIVNGRNQHQVENPKGKYPIFGSGGIMGYANDYICEADTVVLGRKGSINNPIFVETPFWNVDTAFGLCADRSKLVPKYLYYFCEKYDFGRLNTTVTVRSLTKANLLKVEIPLPPLDEQRRIATVLDKVSDLIAKRREQLDKLDELVKARFVEMFGDPVENDRGWQTQPLDGVCKTIVDCPHSTPSYTDENTGYMCIRTSIVKKNRIMWDEIEYIPEHEYYQRIQRKRPQKGDIVYTREGAILGVAAMIDRDCNVALGQRSMLLSPDTTKCLPQFLSVAMNFESFLRKVLGGVSGSASPHINVGDIKTFTIILPPLALQEKFTFLVEQANKSKLTIQQSLDKLEVLKKALMQQYFG